MVILGYRKSKGGKMKIYRIMNRATKEWREIKASSAQEACEKAGWMVGDCWVREYTQRGGWKETK
jgi:hypothetical protein